MPEPISPVGSQGLTPAASILAASAATVSTAAQGSSASATSATSTTVTSAAIKEIQAAASQAQDDKVTLSTGGAATAKDDSQMTLEEASAAFQQYLKNLPSDLVFQPDYTANIVVFKVVNPVTQKVIRQYPPEDVVRLARAIRQNELQGRSGILLDQSS